MGPVPPAIQAALRVVFDQQQERIARLERRVRELEERLGQNSSNSSRPPSADAPAVKRAPPRPPSGRRRGGQPGHQFLERPLLSPDHVHALKPSACRGHARAGDDPEPLRHQVWELRAVRPAVTEYRLHRLNCPRCRLSTCAALPAGVPAGGHGPRLQSAVSLLTGAYRLSKRMARTLCADLLGVPINTGQVCAQEARTADAIEPAVTALREHVRGQSANVDETGWRHQGRRGWLWVAVTMLATVFEVARSRGGAVARGLVDPAAGRVITTDRYAAYNCLPLRQRQVCWAHLRRDFQAMIDRSGLGRGGAASGCCAVPTTCSTGGSASGTGHYGVRPRGSI